ncbi:MAG: type II toxin-antitoxin system VapC family toxin [Mesorhizobium sp.]|nr:hypothetical protein [Mesorhizobium sp.]TIQ35100.1 MAG: type II toxin-antitoxin system VapC family toxin [Mesorhizobium sp.]
MEDAVPIAGQLKARNLTLATNNLSEFSCAEGLEVEDRTAA